MFKKLFFLLLTIFFLSSPGGTCAQEDFFVDAKVEYNIQESGKTMANFNITLENANNEVYATSYTLNLKSVSPKNIKAFYRGIETPIEKIKKDDSTSLKIKFDDVVVGISRSRNFIISFEEDSLAERTGEVWEISIPKLEDVNIFRNYSIVLSVPKHFGNLAFISPDARKVVKLEKLHQYFFEKEDVAESGISAGFGNFQVFSFTLNYHLENPLNQKAPIEIAIPPDTSFQKLYYQKIDPLPENILVDADGNWLASYTLKPRERIDISVIGSVQIFSDPIKIRPPSLWDLSENTKSTEFWETEDQKIKELAQNLKTTQAIYDYVSKNLKYDYQRVKPNAHRLGAKEALKNPESVICMEFTDLFIALARAAGIPAREINGYAYSENPEIQPLSLVADVLHAWPEYWDEERGIWIPVDPTWGSTTGGVDYFSKLDLRHFTFVIHGRNDKVPYPPGSYKLGSNPQKDVYVSFGQLPKIRKGNLEIIALSRRKIPFLSSKILFSINNPGPTSYYDLHPQVYFDEKVVQETYIESLPPFSQYQMSVFIPFSFFGKNIPSEINISVADTELKILSGKTQIIIINLITFLSFLAAIIIFVLYKSGRLIGVNKIIKKYAIYKRKGIKKES